MTDTIQKKPRLRKTRAPAEHRPGHWSDLDAVAEKVLTRRGRALYEAYKAWIWGPRATRLFKKADAMGMLNLFIVERFYAEIDERVAEINQLAQDVLTPDGRDRYGAFKMILAFGKTRLTDALDQMESFVKDRAAIEATDDMAGLYKPGIYPLMYRGPVLAGCPREGARP